MFTKRSYYRTLRDYNRIMDVHKDTLHLIINRDLIKQGEKLKRMFDELMVRLSMMEMMLGKEGIIDPAQMERILRNKEKIQRLSDKVEEYGCIEDGEWENTYVPSVRPIDNVVFSIILAVLTITILKYIF